MWTSPTETLVGGSSVNLDTCHRGKLFLGVVRRSGPGSRVSVRTSTPDTLRPSGSRTPETLFLCPTARRSPVDPSPVCDLSVPSTNPNGTLPDSTKGLYLSSVPLVTSGSHTVWVSMARLSLHPFPPRVVPSLSLSSPRSLVTDTLPSTPTRPRRPLSTVTVTVLLGPGVRPRLLHPYLPHRAKFLTLLYVSRQVHRDTGPVTMVTYPHPRTGLGCPDPQSPHYSRLGILGKVS